VAIDLYEHAKGGPIPVPKEGPDPVMIAVYVAGMHLSQIGPVHVMTKKAETATSLVEVFRRVFGSTIPVSRVGEPSFSPKLRIAVGTYAEFEAARSRFDCVGITIADQKTLALAFDPPSDQARLDMSRRYSRIIDTPYYWLR
jgi:hypothetical protein